MSSFQIKNWAKYQHYGDKKQVPWIKLQYEILTSEDFSEWDNDSKLLAIVCMLVASRHDGKVPNNPKHLQRLGNLDKLPDFKPLIDSGFLIDETFSRQVLTESREDLNLLEDSYSSSLSSSLSNSQSRQIQTEEIPKPKLLERSGPLISNGLPDRDEFDEFWEAYPLKTRRNDAELAFDVAINKGTTPNDLVKAAKSYAESDLNDGKGNKFKFAKNPVDWLRDERFKDFMPKPREVIEIPEWLSNPKITKRFDQSTIINWLKPLKYQNGGDQVTLTAPNNLIFKWVNERHRDDLEAVLGKSVKITLEQPEVEESKI